MRDVKCGQLISVGDQKDSDRHVSDRRGDEFSQRLKGATLVTAEVLYYMPDHPKLLQTFMWQTLDMAPQLPRLSQFLDFWRREIEAVIHSVRVSHGEPLDVPDWRNARSIISMN